MQALKRFSKEAVKTLMEEIEDAGGNEVFAHGFLDESGLVAEISVTARGNIDSVLALRKELRAVLEEKKAGKKNKKKFYIPDVFIHNHPSGFLQPSDPDMIIAGETSREGAGFFIVDNDVSEVYVVAECIKRKSITELSGDEICAALEEGGIIAERLPVFEKRDSQLELLRLITKAFNEDAVAAAEAGTGVGKSFAYLLPAMIFAEKNEERLVISTATITLQQQLYEKDIPLVASALNSSLKTVLVKGRGNYLCRRRLDDALKEQGELDEEENQSLEAVARWAETSINGSLSDLSFVPPSGLWQQICSEADACLGLHCRERERCFFLALRRETSDARLLVVNHHLLFADLSARKSGAGYENTVVLPPYNRVIIDEAHKIEDAATSFFSEQFTRLGIFQQLGRLYRKRRAKKSGLILRAASFIPGFSQKEEDKIFDLISDIRSKADELDEKALLLCGNEGVFRLTPEKDGIISSNLFSLMKSFRKKINSLSGTIQDLLEKIPDSGGEESAASLVSWEIKSILRRLDNAGAVLLTFTEYAVKPDLVCWIEVHKQASKTPWAAFTATPLDISLELKDSLFDPNKTVACVSATLTVGEGSFEYWKNRSGLSLLKDRLILTGIYDSPFPYQTEVFLGVPSDAPLPNNEGFQNFVDDAAASLAEISGGSALVLFTSYTALNSAWQKTKTRLSDYGIRILKQGEDDRSRLLKTFLDDEKSILFGTDSFWEGVDAPGAALKLVIICRLPFKTPGDPVFEARCEKVEQEGGNSFMELSLPEAVMKFKQGFGRLMRRSSDRGAVIVLDGRLLKKQYGKIFLQSLPRTKTAFGDFNSVLKNLENFLYP